MAEYIERKALRNAMYAADGITMNGVAILNTYPNADVAPMVHGVPISKNRPQKHEIYKEAGTDENGEILYRKRIYVDEKNSVKYCPICGKRLCSRFRSFCPNCGAKMDLED